MLPDTIEKLPLVYTPGGSISDQDLAWTSGSPLRGRAAGGLHASADVSAINYGCEGLNDRGEFEDMPPAP
ncbi:hypothetical protein BN2475_520020 [Paraburkholderia ribeironis]|uniref:Uncharacterized protein n=1 Tax=Paraburkholderia ribeironis TaxID=1247936 RepID=A0A1N7SCB7_9BURK|nr:hypothetical protein BN2475_520020 [Paraburkholderia ribeironis]